MLDSTRPALPERPSSTHTRCWSPR